MRVLMLNYEYPPLGGGAASATLHMARDLARMGWEVVVLTSGQGRRRTVEHVDGVELRRVPVWRKGVHDAGLRGALSYLLLARLELGLLLKERDFDIAHFYFALPTGLLSRYWRSRTGKPYVVSLRGSDVPYYDSDSLPLRAFHRLLHGRTKRILSGAHTVVANSNALRRLARRAFPKQRIEVITNGVCARQFRPAAAREGRMLTAICVARLTRRKGVEDAVRAVALARSKALRLRLVGLGPLQARIRELAERLDVADRIEFRGHLTGQALARAYREADLFVLPSLSESFSMALLEGMATGLPVVATDVGGTPELVVDGENGLLVPRNDPRGLAAALDTLAESAELRARFGENNRRKIESSYSWPAIVGEYIAGAYPEPVEAGQVLAEQ